MTGAGNTCYAYREGRCALRQPKNSLETHTTPANTTNEPAQAQAFYAVIGLPELAKTLTPATPFVYWTMEIYDQSNGIKGGGGLGVLAADTRRVADELNIPYVLVTPFYRKEYHQRMDGFLQGEWIKDTAPEDHGFTKIDSVSILTAGTVDTPLDIYEKRFGSTRIICMTEPNFGALYQDVSGSYHRLYQEISLGFAGHKALQRLGIAPAAMQLNESATVFAAIAQLDAYCCQGMRLDEALHLLRSQILYTNHTLLQGAEGEFSREQFAQFVLPNIISKAVHQWVLDQFSGDSIRLSTLTIELAAAKNGVSKFHAQIADFHDKRGNKVTFNAVTNGIDLKTWVLPEIREYYHRLGILDAFDMPVHDYQQRLEQLDSAIVRELKRLGRHKMNAILAHRHDQYGHGVHIPDDVMLFDFKRRYADYKRPGMVFEQPDTLAHILQGANAHLVFAGKPHNGDDTMVHTLNKVLASIDAHPVLKERVHYVQDYDEEVALALAVGSDIALNVPVIGLEACGTSWEKDLANLKLLISTADGGVADLQPPACLEVTGNSYQEELDSLYAQLRTAADIHSDDHALRTELIRELGGYLPVLSGARMLKDYLHLLFR